MLKICVYVLAVIVLCAAAAIAWLVGLALHMLALIDEAQCELHHLPPPAGPDAQQGRRSER